MDVNPIVANFIVQFFLIDHHNTWNIFLPANIETWKPRMKINISKWPELEKIWGRILHKNDIKYRNKLYREYWCPETQTVDDWELKQSYLILPMA